MRRDWFFHVMLDTWIQLRKIDSNRSLHLWESSSALIINHALFGSFEVMNRAVQTSFVFCACIVRTAKPIKNINIFNRIKAEGIEMTIFLFDFQDLIKIVGIYQPANRLENISCWCWCCWYYSQTFPERTPVILLVASTLLAHLSNDSGCRFLLRFTNNGVLCRPAWLRWRKEGLY